MRTLFDFARAVRGAEFAAALPDWTQQCDENDAGWDYGQALIEFADIIGADRALARFATLLEMSYSEDQIGERVSADLWAVLPDSVLTTDYGSSSYDEVESTVDGIDSMLLAAEGGDERRTVLTIAHRMFANE